MVTFQFYLQVYASLQLLVVSCFKRLAYRSGCLPLVECGCHLSTLPRTSGNWQSGYVRACGLCHCAVSHPRLPGFDSVNFIKSLQKGAPLAPVGHLTLVFHCKSLVASQMVVLLAGRVKTCERNSYSSLAGCKIVEENKQKCGRRETVRETVWLLRLEIMH